MNENEWSYRKSLQNDHLSDDRVLQMIFYQESRDLQKCLYNGTYIYTDMVKNELTEFRAKHNLLLLVELTWAWTIFRYGFVGGPFSYLISIDNEFGSGHLFLEGRGEEGTFLVL